MKNNGFIFDRAEGYFIKEETLIKRIERLEEQQKEILELLSNTNKKSKFKIDNETILKGEIIQKSYKLNKEIADRFNYYCKEHREEKAQNILSLALLEFLERNT